MNKKFFTLLAAAGMMATAVNAQVITYKNDGKPSSNIGGVATTAVDARYPWTPFASVTAPSVKITELKNIDKGVEKDLYQFQTADGDLLAMQWNADVKKYQLVLVAPADDANAFVDETLWEVKAYYVGTSKDLRYTLVNKAAQLPLQLNPAGNVDGATVSPAYVEGNVITWSWSNVAKSANASTALSGIMSAAVDANYSVMLTSKEADGKVKVTRVKNDAVAGGLVFSAYKAAPIHLNAAQINAMMTGSKTQAPVQFSMSPEIAGSEYGNALTSGTFTAWENYYADYTAGGSADNTKANADLYQKKSTEIAIEPGYVVLSADKELKNLLRVDTVYHNNAKDARYELRLTTDEAKAPREAYVIQKDYSIEKNELTNAVVAAMKKQAQFRFQYNPSEQSVMVQALQYLYLDKDAKVSWWKALVSAGDDGDGATFDPVNGGYTGVATPDADHGGDYALVNTLTPKTTTYVAALKNGGNVDGTITEVDVIAPQFVADVDNEYILSKAAVTAAATAATSPWAFNRGWANNLIKLTTLTSSPKHTELTVGYDSRDNEFDGINTLIQLGDYTKKNAAYIPSGYYYIKNGNKSTDLLQNGYYRYHDLAATNFTETRFDSDKNAWDLVNTNAYATVNDLISVEKPNTVYSPVKLENIPSAQWYIGGEAGYYTITNRESGLVMNGGEAQNNVYLWEVEKDGVVVPNTFACKGFADPSVNDTIVIEQVPVMDLKAGYLNISQEEAKLQTSVFDFKFASYGTDTMHVGQSNNILKVLNDPNTQFKVERVRQAGKDKYTGKDVTMIEDLYYGFPAQKDTLRRAMYRIYVEDVTSNDTEATGLRTRTYVALEGGKYILTDVVVNVDEDGYTTFDADKNTSYSADPRKCFFIKHITNEADEFVLVDPETTATADAQYKGVRAFVNQQTGILQPAGLKSQGASNVFDASVFTFAKITKYNYRDIRREGIARDTVVLFKDGNPAIKLYETTGTKGANVSLLARDNKEQFTKNFALFVDTANVDNADMPIFLLGLRPVDDEEVSSIPSHNKHLSTTADYLMVLTDSAKVNKAYMDTYGNIRLGFVNATHYADRTLKLTNSDKTFDLSKKALTPATFAFRYVDTARDAFYIETADTDGAPAWVKVINEVPVIVKDIKEAEIYNVEATSENPTANDNVTVSNVTVEATTGAVIVKNAAGLKVTVSNLLGQPVASEVLSSDNATIAAPAGVVVVAVEGAEAVKAIVK